MAERYVHEFIEGLKGGLEEIDEEAVGGVVDMLWNAYQNCHRVFLMGNGGSAAAASHFCCDLNLATRDRKRMQAVSLNDNTPLLTALANDFGYESVFSEQLANLVLPGDVVVVISASGDSENILRALRLAKERGAITVGILGFGGGKASELLDHGLVISSRDFFLVESVHASLTHLLAGLLGRRIHG
ncbi:MAG: SIS domain-containing protein [Polyangia bacterium]|jgi:D-sedoheptulose 7-phosphate isomerase|nr:SIS domain-containing protein [Polyangia bacterium]